MEVDVYSLGIVLLIAVMLLIADRVYRINPILFSEGFAVAGYPERCGVDLEPCPFGKRCMNGFCFAANEQPQMYDRNPLPVLP